MAVIGYIYSSSGYQYVGMGRKVYDSMWGLRQFYDKVEKKYPEFRINKLSFIGPEEELMKEENGSIINAAYQAGLFEVFKYYKIKPEQIAGIKNGELMALACAECMSFEDALFLLKAKNEMIFSEISREKFRHLHITGVPVEKTEQVCAEVNKTAKTEVTVYCSPDNAVVICETGIESKLTDVFKKLGGKVALLPNEEMGNFSLLEGVTEKVNMIFKDIKTDKPVFRTFSQVKGDFYDNAAEIRETVFNYIHKPARLDKIITGMIKNGVNTFVEIGAGTFAGKVAKKIDSGKRILNTHDLAGLSTAIKLAN